MCSLGRLSHVASHFFRAQQGGSTDNTTVECTCCLVAGTVGLEIHGRVFFMGPGDALFRCTSSPDGDAYHERRLDTHFRRCFALLLCRWPIKCHLMSPGICICATHFCYYCKPTVFFMASFPKKGYAAGEKAQRMLVIVNGRCLVMHTYMITTRCCAFHCRSKVKFRYKKGLCETLTFSYLRGFVAKLLDIVFSKVPLACNQRVRYSKREGTHGKMEGSSVREAHPIKKTRSPECFVVWETFLFTCMVGFHDDRNLHKFANSDECRLRTSYLLGDGCDSRSHSC